MIVANGLRIKRSGDDWTAFGILDLPVWSGTFCACLRAANVLPRGSGRPPVLPGRWPALNFLRDLISATWRTLTS